MQDVIDVFQSAFVYYIDLIFIYVVEMVHIYNPMKRVYSIGAMWLDHLL